MQDRQEFVGLAKPVAADIDSDGLSPKPLLDNFVPFLAAGGIILSALFHLHLLTAAIGVLLGMMGVAKLWSVLSLRAVVGERRLSYPRLFPGDTADLIIRLENRKALPLPWLQAAQPLPRGLTAADGSTIATAKSSLVWYRAATFRLPLTCRKRGYYHLMPATISSGDPLGVYPQRRELRQNAGLLVYPRLFPLPELGLRSTTLFGDSASARRLLLDPTNSAGSRDYVPGDPIRHIHWKATAKRQHHQVKVFDPSTNWDTLLLLAVDSFGDRAEDDLELAISAAASLAFFISERNSPVGLVANARLHTRADEPSIPPRTGQEHLGQILEALALISGTPSHSFSALLEAQSRTLPRDATLVFIHAGPSAVERAQLRRLQALGYRVVIYVLQGGEGRGEQLEEYSLHDLVPSAATAAGAAS